MTKKNILDRHVWQVYVVIIFLAALDAVVSVAFIYPNDFAPVGVQGIATIIQYSFNVSVGYLYILANAPMLIAAFFILNKSYAFKNLCYIGSFSVSTLAVQSIIRNDGMQWLEYRAKSSESAVLVAMAYGAFLGLTYTATVSLGGSTGGSDILASLINKKRPSFNTVWILFFINAGVAVVSFFVYGREALPVILSVICALVTGTVSDRLLRGVSSALKFEIITDKPDELAEQIMKRLSRGCTQISAKGMYSQTSYAVLMCVINKRQRFEMERLLSKYRGSFCICTPVRSIYGDFRRGR